MLQGREAQIEAINETFEQAKEQPRHPTKPELQPMQIMPVLPDFAVRGVKMKS